MMSGVDQSKENFVKGICSKCEERKTWNIWYHSDPTLCDDCYYVNGKYYRMTKDEIQQMKSIESSFL